MGSVVSHLRCWADGNVQCPYGEPNGEFVSRPEVFCGTNCKTYEQHVLSPEKEEEQRVKAIKEHFKKSSISLITLLARVADGEKKESPAWHALKLTVETAKGRSLLNFNVITEEELPPK